ncbi:hypothetical protein Tsubulata_026725 [Turnera subulata]|uniref:Mediator of RNA polymerase II transcription subunit 9 n=1 Tax=Turnera subulata TaxID=218843 RepID=A0A9Q0JPI7_9ROSI|nr:hypothetical protein Tsubulata_026725 [Turnera subulata]
MDPYGGGGSWTMIPNVGNSPAHSNQDQFYLHQSQQQLFNQFQPPPQQQQSTPPPPPATQQQQFQQQPTPQQFNQQQQPLLSPQQQPLLSPQQQQQQQFHQQQRFIAQQQQQQQQQPQQQQPPTPQQQQNSQYQSLASHFHLLPLVENLADVIETGNRDQHSDALVTELKTHFEKCQQLLNSISSSINARSMLNGSVGETVEGQKRKLEEGEQLLNQRRELISQYRSSVEELTKSGCKISVEEFIQDSTKFEFPGENRVL